MPKLVPLCPTCFKNKAQNKLSLKQINQKLAVYLCDIPTCTYPEGYDFLLENRTLKEWIEDERKREKRKRKRKTKMLKNIEAISNENIDVTDILNELNNIPQETIDLENLLEDEIQKLNNTRSSLPGLDEYLNCYANNSFIDNSLDDILGTITQSEMKVEPMSQNEIKIVKQGNKVKILEMITFSKKEEPKESIDVKSEFVDELQTSISSKCEDVINDMDFFSNLNLTDYGDMSF